MPQIRTFLCILAGLTVLADAAPVWSQALVPGYARFRESLTDSVAAGRVLISELGCQACHGPLAGSPDIVPPRIGPVLTEVSSRVNPEYIRDYIRNPHGVKPGTTMPEFTRLREGDAAQQDVAALTAFLTQSSTFRHAAIHRGGIERGAELFHTIGCAACHADPAAPEDPYPAFLNRLPAAERKYSLSGLVAFLTSPHAVRPSGRMPSLNPTADESRDIASFLLRDLDDSLVDASLNYEVFEGSWESLPDFAALEAVETGAAADFDVGVTSRTETFALRFHGYLQIPRDGDYRFWLASDDGSRLLIDDDVVLEHDGVHPASERSTRIPLTKGAHRLVVEYFEFHGEESLTVEIQGRGIARQTAANVMTRTETPPAPRSANSATPADAAMIGRGRELFADLGCAACHEYRVDDKRITSSRAAPMFAAMKLDGGCLNRNNRGPAPRFDLSDQQIADLQQAIQAGPTTTREPNGSESQIATAMLTLNCVACHRRGELGGVPSALNERFTGRIPEMGDEGRIPPALDGVGDKLNEEWLRHILREGGKDRSYMVTRMPKFAADQTAQLAELLSVSDRGPEVGAVEMPEAEHRVKSSARLIVGDQALGCIKCHSFDRYQATGIQAMDLTTMTKRLRRDWFHRYLMDPQAYRPGTRMPAAWPNGRSVVPQILDSSPAVQIEALWVYLLDGTEARIPSGLVAEAIELKPVDRPIIYRNFIEGLSPRGIAVGFPQQAHFAWDAEHCSVRLIWHNAFIDASKHWTGRGPGTQVPLGDHVMTLPAGPPIADLAGSDAAWPAMADVRSQYAFSGYRLDEHGTPTFRYRWNDVRVTDRLSPIPAEPDATLRRALTFERLPESSFLRIAAGRVRTEGHTWIIDDAIRIRGLSHPAVLRPHVDNATSDLLIPLTPDASGSLVVEYELQW